MIPIASWFNAPTQPVIFIISFYQNGNGLFRTHFEVDHSCDLYVPNIKRKWLSEKVQFLISTRATISTKEVNEWVHETYGFYPLKNIVGRVICAVQKGAFGGNSAFGTIASFFEELKAVNDGSPTSLKVVEGCFQRPFLALGICIKAFAHTPHVFGLDACHIKAAYGGALLVLTVLDETVKCFLALSQWPEAKTSKLGGGFLTLFGPPSHLRTAVEWLS